MHSSLIYWDKTEDSKHTINSPVFLLSEVLDLRLERTHTSVSVCFAIPQLRIWRRWEDSQREEEVLGTESELT